MIVNLLICPPKKGVLGWGEACGKPKGEEPGSNSTHTWHPGARPGTGQGAAPLRCGKPGG